MKRLRIENCPFCKSDVGEIAFVESPNFIAIYNRAPILPGHSLIIPRWHIQSLLELSDSELSEMMLFSRNTVIILLKVFNSSAFNWTIQEGKEAGQTVPHLHLHLIPREPKDHSQPGDWYPLLRKSESEVIDSASRSRLTRSEIKKIVEGIKATM